MISGLILFTAYTYAVWYVTHNSYSRYKHLLDPDGELLLVFRPTASCFICANIYVTRYPSVGLKANRLPLER
jgi:hypothetical protein